MDKKPNEGVHELVKELCRILARQEPIVLDKLLALPNGTAGPSIVIDNDKPLPVNWQDFHVNPAKDGGWVLTEKPKKFKIGPASEGVITDTSVEQSRWVITSHECREEQSHPEPKQETWRDRPPLL